MSAMASGSALDASVLVLNRLFMAVHVISVRRAFALLCKELAEVVSHEDGQFASYNFTSWREVSEYRVQFPGPDDDFVRADFRRAVNCEPQVPRVIRLLFYDKLPKQTVKFNRRNIFARDNNRCQYCGKRFSTTELSLDHVLPRSRGDKSFGDTVSCPCLKCNVRKGGRPPAEAHLTLVRKPEKPKRNPL